MLHRRKFMSCSVQIYLKEQSLYKLYELYELFYYFCSFKINAQVFVNEK